MIKKHSIVIFIIILLTLFSFNKIFTKHRYPNPGNLLVSFYYPWSSGGWSGYNALTTHKEQIGSDALRQHIPWHNLTFTSIRNGIFPLWNPYNFSGSPHLANMQTFIFNPINVIFLVLPLFTAWNLFIVLQFPLVIYFTYLFVRSLKLSRESALLAGVIFAFSSYFIYWLEIGIVGYSILWLPLILFSIQKLSENFKIRYFCILTFATLASLLAGHIQTSLFVFLLALFFWLVKIINIEERTIKIKSIKFLFLWLSSFVLGALQIIPALQLYLNSPLTEPFSKEVFDTGAIPYPHLLSFFAPDFFGNPATNNFWAKKYGDGTPSIGSLPLFFAALALFNFKKWEIKFFFMTAVIFILFAVESPLFYLVKNLNIPILVGTAPIRTIFIACFSLSVLSAYGFELFFSQNKVKTKFYILFSFFIAVYIVLLSATIAIPKFLAHDAVTLARFTVAKRNLLIPLLALLSLPFGVIVTRLTKIVKINGSSAAKLIVFTAIVMAGYYQFNKTLPFSPKADFFPPHPVITWLQNNASINRFHGDGTSVFDNDFASYYHIYSAEGYSVFRIKRYAQLMAMQTGDKIPKKYGRADAELSTASGENERRLMNLLGVKYALAKDDQARDAKVNDVDKPDQTYNFLWQEGKFKIYERPDALPRFFLSSNFIVAKNDQEIIKNIFNRNFDLKTLILEKRPTLDIQDSQNATVDLVSYTPNVVKFKVSTDANTLLFLSDAYYPGWKAYIDNETGDVLRADYALRAVEVPKGNHNIEFRFEPFAFKLGLLISGFSFILFSTFVVFSIKRREF